MVQYYTLQEAAAMLHVTPEQLKEMAKKNEVRAFQDRGNLRFRAQEIDELARSRGHGSDPELPLGEVGAPKSSPKSPTPKPTKTTKSPIPPSDQEIPLNLDPANEEVPIGRDPASSGGSSKNTPRNTNTRSPKPQRSGLSSPSPRPEAGSDSDVRLVGDEGAIGFQVDSEVKVEKSPSPGPKSSGVGKKSKVSKVDAAPDSGVRILPLDDASDSDVKIIPDEPDSNVPIGQAKSKTPSDSDIRLEEVDGDSGKSKREDKNLVTEEIDLDLDELKAAQETAKRQASAKPKSRFAAPAPPLAQSSPFELSDPEVEVKAKGDSGKGLKPSKTEPEKKSAEDDSSSDFELAPLGESPLELGSDENTPIRLDSSSPIEEDVGLGELTGPSGGKTGINLEEPADSGISLEQGGSDEMDLEVSLDAGATPQPSAKVDSSSDFELSLDDSDSSPEAEEGSSSEFELTLDEGSPQGEEGTSSEFELSLDLESSSEEVAEDGQGSDSEFELTIDDDGGLASLEENPELQEEDKDIFETDFEVPALDEESGSEAVALDEGDTDLENSDFDLAVDEESDTEAESASEVVALDEDEEGEEVEDDSPAAKRKKRGSRTAVLEEEEDEAADFGDLEEEVEEEPEEEEMETVAAAPAKSEWGVIPALCMTPCAFIMVIVCLMSYEMIGGMWGYHKPAKTSNLIVDSLARTISGDEAFPKD